MLLQFPLQLLKQFPFLLILVFLHKQFQHLFLYLYTHTIAEVHYFRQ
jgi:hypothetical protein